MRKAANHGSSSSDSALEIPLGTVTRREGPIEPELEGCDCEGINVWMKLIYDMNEISIWRTLNLKRICKGTIEYELDGSNCEGINE